MTEPWHPNVTRMAMLDPTSTIYYVSEGKIQPIQTFVTNSPTGFNAKHGVLYCTAIEEDKDEEVRLALMFGRQQIAPAIVGLAGLALSMDDRYLKRTRYTLKRLAGEL